MARQTKTLIVNSIDDVKVYERQGYSVKTLRIMPERNTLRYIIVLKCPVKAISPDDFIEKGEVKKKMTSVDKLLYDIQEEILDFQASDPEEVKIIENGLENIKQLMMKMRLSM